MKVEFEIGFPYVMLKSRKIIDHVINFGRKHKKFFAIYGIIAILVGMFASAFGFVFLFDALNKAKETGKAQVGLLIPGVKLPGTNYKLPLVKGLLAIFLIALIHELSHAIVGVSYGILPRFFAFIVFLIIPAAGVEFNEEKLKKEPKFKKLAIFAAGSMGNFVLALIAILLFNSIAHFGNNFVDYTGVTIINTTNPNLKNYINKTIIEINNTKIETIEDLHEYLSGIEENTTALFKFSDNTTSNVSIQYKDGRGFLGVYIKQNTKLKLGIISKAYLWLLSFLFLLFNLNLGVGIVNMLPLPPLDGGRIYQELIDNKIIKKGIFTITGILLLLNLLWPWIKFLF